MSVKGSRPINLFYFYSTADKELCNELDKTLILLRKQGFITAWDSHAIEATEPALAIEKRVDAAHIILCLLSPDFLISDHSEGIEVQYALARHSAEKARVIPVILRPVHFERSLFSKFQVLPAGAKPVTSWLNRDEAFFNIGDCLRNVVHDVQARGLRK